MAEIEQRSIASLCVLILVSFSSLCISNAYRPGDIVPMSKMGLYHSMKTEWHDMIGRHCPIFSVNREVLIPIVMPTGYTGADAYKMSFQVGREKFLIPWLFVINPKSSEVPMIDFHLKYSGSDLHGITAKVVDMPHHYTEVHPDIRKQFWDPKHWPKHVLVRYTWEEQSEKSANIYKEFEQSMTEAERTYLNNEERARRFEEFKAARVQSLKNSMINYGGSTSTSRLDYRSCELSPTFIFNSTTIHLYINIFLVVFLFLLFLAIQLRPIGIRILTSIRCFFIPISKTIEIPK